MMTTVRRTTHVPLGRVFLTSGARHELPPREVQNALEKHQRGDWGLLPDDEKMQNDLCVELGESVTSVYRARNGDVFLVRTARDRSETTVLLLEEN